MQVEKHTFGDHLKREREMRGVSLGEIAAATRISTRFLAALENEEWERLPGGVFNRGFVRAVARFLGLDEDGLVAEYATITHDRPQIAVWAEGVDARSRKVWPWATAFILFALAISSFFGYRLYGTEVKAWLNARHQQSAARSVTPTPSIKPPDAATANPPSGAAAPASQVEPVTLQLKIEAGKTTHITVIADGKTIFDDQLNAGENRRFQATQQFQVAAQDSSAVLLELNGQTMPPLGAPDQPGTATLTREDLKNQ